MAKDLDIKVQRLNELYTKKERENTLSNQELTEQSVLRDEIINYFQFALRNDENKQ